MSKIISLAALDREGERERVKAKRASLLNSALSLSLSLYIFARIFVFPFRPHSGGVFSLIPVFRPNTSFVSIK